MKTRIHVRRDLMNKDRKEGTRSRVLGVETSGMRKRYGRSVTVNGPVKFVYRPNDPLHCGAKAWAETDAPVIVHGR